MNSHTSKAVDLAEVASEVVRVAYEDGLTLSGSIMKVLSERKLDFGNAMEILKMAQTVVNENEDLAEAISQNRKHRPMNLRQLGYVARTAQALQDIEDRAPVIEFEQKEPPLPITVLENGQHVFWDIVPTVLRRAGR